MYARLLIVLVILLIGARTIASTIIDFEWWKELGQAETWWSVWFYSVAPVLAGSVAAGAVFWAAHARGFRAAARRLRDYPRYLKLASVGAFVLGWLVTGATVDTWTVVRWFGFRGTAATEWHDPVFTQPLSFYLFSLPFYNEVRGWVLAVALIAAVIYLVTSHAWEFQDRFRPDAEPRGIDINFRALSGAAFLRGAAAIFLLGLAVRFWLGRYEMVWNDHSFMVGVDYVDDKIALPLQWLSIGACVAAAGLVLARQWIFAALVPLAMLISLVVPAAVGSFYVRPNEISLERPYIERHIQATRLAYGLQRHLKEVEFPARQDAPIDTVKHKHLLDNVRLWELRAFHDTVTQIQALRPYYTFADSDVDRYRIDGQLRQVLLTPRELDIRQLPDARTRWINPHFIYTHGYGVVLAEVARITPDGLPVLLIQDAPAVSKIPSLQLTRPELYFGEVVHEPVFVHTALDEFNFPKGDTNVLTRYAGKGGIPISSLPMRIAAALREGELNILLTGYLTDHSRMMIRRNVRERVNALADFLTWDSDPYLVITDAGHLVWMIDGYTTSRAHPYSRRMDAGDLGRLNYIRNSVKATVDAYDGETHLYVFDDEDPILGAWRTLFPRLFEPKASMPKDLRAHARYPEMLFRVQSEIYRTFHMRDPQAFYNKEDVWDIARYASGQAGSAKALSPTYIVGTLPDSDEPEFLLLLPFTPRGKDNLIGMMVARCDGEHLGEMYVLELSKQQLIYGPMQIAAQINQDQNISKDLTLWNQQGSQVLRGQTLVLPIGATFLYIEPIYIQAVEGRMPQLKKVVLARGSTLIYTDNYEQALAQLSAPAKAAVVQAVTQTAAAAPSGDPRLDRIREHFRKYRELSSRGQWAEAGRELEAIEKEVR